MEEQVKKKRRRPVSKEVRCLICNRRFKRRKYRKIRMGPTCARKLADGYAGIQIKAFEPLPSVICEEATP